MCRISRTRKTLTTSRRQAMLAVVALAGMLALTACGGGGGGGSPAPATYTVGGSVSGLTGSGLVLRNNGTDNLAISASGSFTFATALAGGSSYSVTVYTQPSGQTCTVSNGSGTIGSSNVTNVSVTCVALHTVTISWAPNREAAVNQTGGGYIVSIVGKTPITVPYVSGSLAPTSTTASLTAGTYTVSVSAYSALNIPGGTGGSTSASSASITVTVP